MKKNKRNQPRKRSPTGRPMVRRQISFLASVAKPALAYCDERGIPFSVFVERATRRYLRRLQKRENGGAEKKTNALRVADNAPTLTITVSADVKNN